MRRDVIAPVGLNLDQAPLCAMRLQPLVCVCVQSDFRERGRKLLIYSFFFFSIAGR